MRSHRLKAVPRPAQLRVAIYARVSSDQQAERQTIDSQLSELQAAARRDGHEVQDGMLFVDNGQSGTTLIRPALERLRDMVALSAIDVIYVHAPDRLARSYAHQVLLLEEFAPADARVMFLNRPIGDSPEDNLLLQLQGMFAEYERAKLLERSRRGKRHRAAAGAISVLSRAPFGYRYIGREAGGGEARYDIDETRGPGGSADLRLGRAGAPDACRGMPTAPRGRYPEPDGPGALEPGHGAHAAAQPRLHRPCRLWPPSLRTLAGAPAFASRARRGAAAALAAGAGATRATHQSPGAGDRRRGAIRRRGGAARGEPQAQP
jgi:DNA invertase Pin-like site-specific DNA recombinase